ncbi:2',5'-phosphodiesterase 12 isoform X2 [Condylostylus longicornis]|uniref:2',5'-phosphodiesterase 12 isoform X2 n=1 Tax=Condylostylus longicornis TaxID=2530218 RepID=UPI00244E0543|nr:2',5'-phosphodiesterase 12 isoform X2 [Condylostylus longicornis]
MNKVYFRHNAEDNQLQINFRYKNSNLNVDRDFNFCRNANENVIVCLDRIKNNIEKEFTKKSKKKKQKKSEAAVGNNQDKDIIVPEILVQLLQNDEPVKNDETFASILNLSEGNGLVLRILNDYFQIQYNKPWVLTVTLPSVILAGYYLYPNKLEMQYATKEDSIGIWYKGIMPKSKNIMNIVWEKVGEGLFYCTKNEDIGHLIRFELKPSNGKEFGPTSEVISKTEVQAGPGFCPFENRHLFTQSRLKDDRFRVVSYNLLADYYADSDYSRKELFPYCPPYALNIEYRKQLFIKEITGYNADIICLQELDSKVFELDLVPILQQKMYEGILQKKGSTAEGICIFYQTVRFDLIRSMSINIGENIANLNIFSNLHSKIAANKPLMERVTDRATTLQVVILRSRDTGHFLIVANTHLYFHPDADHIRLLQIGFSMIYVKNVYEELLKEYKLSLEQLSIIFCGDFNSVPECGIYKLMTEKHVGEDFIDWSKKEEAVKNVSLEQPFDFGSACGCPTYTNYTHLFSGCLDYIFYQKNNLEVEQVIPLPTDEEIKAHIAIPSVVFPSDHIALVADLKFKSTI